MTCPSVCTTLVLGRQGFEPLPTSCQLACCPKHPGRYQQSAVTVTGGYKSQFSPTNITVAG